MTYYIIYKVTNQINGKIYIGSHKTKNLNDGYMGSGKYLKYSQAKHGIENFTKEILFVFDNPEDMYAKEAEIVNDEFLAEENTYNLKRGGLGGFEYLNSNDYNNPTHTIHHAKKMYRIGYENRLAGLREYFKDPEKVKKATQAFRKTLASNYPDGRRTFAGKTHTDETKQVMSEKAKARMADPTKNPSYGTCWIHSLEEQVSKKIKKEDLDEWLAQGWVQGRKMKF